MQGSIACLLLRRRLGGTVTYVRRRLGNNTRSVLSPLLGSLTHH